MGFGNWIATRLRHRSNRRDDDFASGSVDPWISEAIASFEREMDRVPTPEKRGRKHDAGNTRTAGGDNPLITHCM